MDEGLLAVLVVIAGCFAGAAVASRKGYDPGFWAGIAFVISIFAPIILLFRKQGDRPVKPLSGIPQAIAAVIFGWLAYTVAVQIQPNAEDITCKSMTADVLRASEEGTEAAPGLKVLTISDPVEKSRSDQLIECAGSALIATSATVPISFKAQKTNDQWFVFYTITP